MADRPVNDLPRPTILIDEPDFRLVRVEIGANVEYVLETRDGIDAMGTKRWKKFEHDITKLRAIFGYLTRIAIKQQEK
jgi:hypothetical protein